MSEVSEKYHKWLGGTSRTICPNSKSPHWKRLVEATGDYNTAFQIWEDNGFDYPDFIISEVETQVEAGMEMDSDIDIQTIERKEKLDRAKEIISKKLNALRNNPNVSDVDNETIAEFEQLLNKMNELSAEHAISEFVDAARRMANAANRFLEQVKEGTRSPNLRQYYRIKEFGDTFELVAELIPELREAKGFEAELQSAEQVAAQIESIKQERLRQQRSLLAAQWAPRVGKIEAFYRRKAEVEFNQNERKRYNSKEQQDEKRQEYIDNYLIENSAKIQFETEQEVLDLLSKIDDIGSMSANMVNPKDLHNEVVDFVVEVLDRADFSVRNSVIREAQEISDLRDKYIEYMGSKANPQELYAPLLEKDEEGELTGRYVNPETSKEQHNELMRKYSGTPVMAFYDHVVGKQLDRDELLPRYARLGYDLPKMNRTNVERIAAKGMDVVKHAATDLYKIKDSDLFGDVGDTAEEKREGKRKIITSETGEERQLIPVFYRSNRVEPADQSYDLATLAVIEHKNVRNYKEKSEVLPQINLIMDSVYNGKATQREGMARLLKVSKDTEKAALIDGFKSDVYKVLENIRENRIYGIKLSGDRTTAFATQQVKGFASMVGMGGNVLSASANFFQGTLASWLETFGGKNGLYTAKNRLNGTTKYWKDTTHIIADLGENIPKSKTNLLMQLLDTSESFSPLKAEFVKNNMIKKHLMDSGVFYSLQNSTEHGIHAMLIYAILDNIKVKNSDGNYINQAGEVVESREDAMSIDEAYTAVDGKLVLHSDVASTERTPDVSEDSMFMLSNLVSRTSRDLFGNYNQENKSVFARTIVGNLVEHMRGWMVTGFLKRWKGTGTAFRDTSDLRLENTLYNRETGKIEEGTYVSILRFLARASREIKAHKIKAAGEAWGQMTAEEKANFKKGAFELALILTMLMASKALEDEDEPTAIAAAYLTRRLYNEFFTFSNPNEFLRTARSPAVSLSVLEDALELLGQGVVDSYSIVTGEGPERYKTGRRRGETKFGKKLYDMIPMLKQVNKDLGEQYQFLTK